MITHLTEILYVEERNIYSIFNTIHATEGMNYEGVMW